MLSVYERFDRVEHTLPDGDDYPHLTAPQTACGCYPVVSTIREPVNGGTICVARVAHVGAEERP